MAENTEVKERKEVVRVPVQMTDGRMVGFTERQKCVTERLKGEDGATVGIRFDFKTGDFLTVTQEDVMGLSREFMWHGVEQKYRDEFAAAKETDDAFEWITDLHARIRKGEWREAREGGGVSGVGLLVKALMELHGLNIDQARAFLADKSPKEQVILRDFEPIAAKIREIKARTPRPDTSAKAAELLSALPPAA